MLMSSPTPERRRRGKSQRSRAGLAAHQHQHQWYRRWHALLDGAACKLSQELPWIGNSRPAAQEFMEMRVICHSCPCRAACASYALDPQVPALGGMYAGVWIPWKGEGTNWAGARAELRHQLDKWIED